MILILIVTMLSYLKGYFNLFVFTLIFFFGINLLVPLLANLFVKFKIQNYFKIEDLASGIIILSMLIIYFCLRVIKWYFKRLQEQVD